MPTLVKPPLILNSSPLVKMVPPESTKSATSLLSSLIALLAFVTPSLIVLFATPPIVPVTLPSIVPALSKDLTLSGLLPEFSLVFSVELSLLSTLVCAVLAALVSAVLAFEVASEAAAV